MVDKPAAVKKVVFASLRRQCFADEEGSKSERADEGLPSQKESWSLTVAARSNWRPDASRSISSCKEPIRPSS